MALRTLDAALLAASSPPLGRPIRIWTVRGSPNSWMLASPMFSPSTVERTSSIEAGWAKVTRICWPPRKSTPRFSPRTATRLIEARVTMIDRTRAMLRQRMKSMLVLSGMSFRRRIGQSSNMEFARPRLAGPEGDEHSGDVDGGEDGRDDADPQHDRETADRT